MCGGASVPLAQTEVSLLAPNPFRRTLDKVTAGFEPKTGYKLNITLGRGVGTRQQIARGEMFDVSILLPPYPEELASGNIDPKSATVLAKLALAGGEKKGSANPNVDVVGTLPAEFAPPTDIVAVIATHARDAVAAKALVDYLASLESEAVYEKDGLLPRR